MPKNNFSSDLEGFTLVELLVVIAIIAILAAVGITIYSGILSRARDADRLSDMSEIRSAIQIVMHDATDSASTLCAGIVAPCQGESDSADPNNRATDGTGWIKIDFDAKDIATFPQLPVDPVNNSIYNYQYESDGENWRVSCVLETSSNQNYMKNDGGTDPNRYEVGVGLKSL